MINNDITTHPQVRMNALSREFEVRRAALLTELRVEYKSKVTAIAKSDVPPDLKDILTDQVNAMYLPVLPMENQPVTA